VICELNGPNCQVNLPEEGDGRLCICCYSTLMPYSASNRLLRDEYDIAIANYQDGAKPPAVHDPILNMIRGMGGLQ